MTPSLSLKRLGMTAFVMLLIVAPFILRGASAAPQLVSWGPTQVISKSPSQTNAYPTVDYDSNGKLHIAWMEYGGDPQGSDSRVLYTNNVNGTWISPYEVSSSGGRDSEPLVDLKVVGNEVHVMYFTNSKQVAHRLVTLNGATPSKGPVTTFTGTKGVNPELAVGKDGRIHAFYASRSSNTAPYQIYHRIRTNGAWSSATVVRPDGSPQKFPAAVATNDGNIHLAFMGNDTGVLRYSIFNGSTWQGSTDIAAGNLKQVHMTTDGSTMYVMYSAQPGNFHNVYFRQGGNGGNWSATVMLSSGSSYDENPFPHYSPAMNTVFAFWSSGGGTSSTRVVVREYVPGVGFSGVTDLGGAAVQWPKAASFGGSISAVWEDKVTRIYDVRLRTGTGTGVEPTPQPTVQPTVQPVDFTLNRTTPSPNNSATVGIQVANPLGSPDQMRYSLTPFTADNAAIQWQALSQTAVNVPTGVSGLECGVATIYAQVRNSANGQVSAVKSVSAVVDTAVQAQASISTAENWPGATGLAGQPNAPTNVSPDYTRNPKFYFRINQESSPCAGLKNYQVEGNILTPSSFPVDGSATFNGINTGSDAGGNGWPEQLLEANLVLTDNLNNQAQFDKIVFYDDDAPVLSQGGTITFPNGLNSGIAVVPIEFTASVTDDGYTNSAPADKKYWGAWVVATTSPTMPSPLVFSQYGKVHQLEPGGNSLDYVTLTNDSAPAMRQAGTRYLHIRFLDGAGNYTVDGITSPAITLSDPFIKGLNIYMPLIAR